MKKLFQNLLERIVARMDGRVCPNCASTIPSYHFIEKRQVVVETVKSGFFKKYIKKEPVPYRVLNGTCPYCGYKCMIRKKVSY